MPQRDKADRVPRLLTALALAHGDGRYAKLLRSLSRADVLILDDFGPEVLTAEQRRDLLEIGEDRYNARSLLITSQILIKQLSKPSAARYRLKRKSEYVRWVDHFAGIWAGQPLSPDT